jgi:hypothetical protein
MSFSGSLLNVKLSDVVQMCCLACIDGDLQVTHETLVGQVFIRKGQVVHAQTGERLGEEALYFLLSLMEGCFTFTKNLESPKQSINADWEYLLIEAARCRDQQPRPEKISIDPAANNLTEILQMYCLAGVDGDLQVTHEGSTGHIFLREGQIIHAQAGKKKGEDAFYFLFSLEQVMFEFLSEVDAIEDSIYAHWEQLLRECTRRREEQRIFKVISGDLACVNLADILHMCCLACMNGDLRLAQNGFSGHIYLRRGQIVHAEAGPKKGEDAFQFLLSLKQGQFEFLKDVPSHEESINAQWEYLLIEAARRRDERVPQLAVGGFSSHVNNKKYHALLEGLRKFDGFRGAALLGKSGELLASNFELLEAPLVTLAKTCVTLFLPLEQELAIGDSNQEKQFVFHFPGNVILAFPRNKLLFLVMVARDSYSERTGHILAQAVQASGALMN